MQYWRCSCGNFESFGTDSPAQCRVCDNCHTTLLKNADGSYLPALSHDIKLRYSQSTGKPKSRMCVRCFARFPLEESDKGV